MEGYETEHRNNPERNIPLDIFLRYYFLDNKRGLETFHRGQIVDFVYLMTSWNLYLGAIAKRPANWTNKMYALMGTNFEEQLSNKNLPMHVRASCPEDLWDLLVEAYGEDQAFDLCVAQNERPPLTIRTNTLRTNRNQLYSDLRKRGYNLKKNKFAPNALTFIDKPEESLFMMREYKDGKFEIQDEASQLGAMRVDCRPGEIVVDYCGGAGGKSLAFAPFMQNTGQIFLHDIRKPVIMQAKKRFRKAGISNAQVHHDKTKLWKQLKRKCHWILLDVPCTGTGVLRRNPDQKWKFSEARLKELVLVQDQIIKEVIPMMRPGGRIVYSTCSILPQENLMQVAHACKKYGLELEDGNHFQTLPKAGGMDGFFAATLVKKSI